MGLFWVLLEISINNNDGEDDKMVYYVLGTMLIIVYC